MFLTRVVGQGASLDLLIADLAADLETRTYEIAKSGDAWLLRTRKSYAPVIRAAADIGDQALAMSEADIAVLAAIAYHQPITRTGLNEIFGREISRDVIGRLSARADRPRAARAATGRTAQLCHHIGLSGRVRS